MEKCVEHVYSCRDSKLQLKIPKNTLSNSGQMEKMLMPLQFDDVKAGRCKL